MQQDDGQVTVAVHVAHKMRWNPWRGSIRWVIHLQIRGQIMQPVVEERILLYETGVCSPIFLLFDLVVYIGDDADVVCITDKVGVLSGAFRFILIQASDIQGWAHIDSFGVNAVVRAALTESY